jgi:hypothetical protein
VNSRKEKEKCRNQNLIEQGSRRKLPLWKKGGVQNQNLIQSPTFDCSCWAQECDVMSIMQAEVARRARRKAQAKETPTRQAEPSKTTASGGAQDPE